MIRQRNVLVIDDVTTSGSTLNEILRSLRIVNDDNNITIFSLIGRKDLMAEDVALRAVRIAVATEAMICTIHLMVSLGIGNIFVFGCPSVM